MPIPELEEFAKLLIRHVRDPAIRENDLCLQPSVRAPVAERWREASQRTPTEFAKAIIPDVVDTVVMCLFDAIDNGHLPLTFTASNGQQLDLTKLQDGLAGWYMGREEWLGRYAQEQYADDFTDSSREFVNDLMDRMKLKKPDQ